MYFRCLGERCLAVKLQKCCVYYKRLSVSMEVSGLHFQFCVNLSFKQLQQYNDTNTFQLYDINSYNVQSQFFKLCTYFYFFIAGHVLIMEYFTW